MKTSSYQVLVSLHSNSDREWLLLLQVHVDGVKRELKEVVSSLTVSSSEREVDTDWLGQCDAFTAVYRLTSREDQLATNFTSLTRRPSCHSWPA